MKNLERLALVGALAAAVFVEGSLNARVKDLAQQRDIYQSRSANWERDALNWQTEAKEAEAQVADLKAALEAAQAGPAVKGKALDVAVETHSEALSWPGYGTHRVWLLEAE